MKKIKVAINGFGRIGRMTTRVMLNNPNIEIVAINDLTDTKTLAHLFKYDSVHRIYKGDVSHDATSVTVDGHNIKFYKTPNITELPWRALGIDVVIECTGHYLTTESCMQHIASGAKKVIISAPASDDTKTIVLGINEHMLTSGDVIISNASCTTNCASPMLKVLHENFILEEAYVTTIHSYTGDQRLHDAPHKDLRRARAAAVSMIPTSTGAAKAVSKVFPELTGKIGGCGIRVPVSDGSLTDITCILTKPHTPEMINAAFKKACANEFKGIMEYTEDPIVSVDVVGNPHSCLFDSEFTSVVNNMVKVIGWYDNEWGYSNRLCDLAIKFMAV
ncbi:MAG: type I glyceraldehyde-3-phosphate dehydrogenase [Bacteroidia bacterium]|nr:type I glyceraldehyde-3-phosphate dehydrogenase [Bacteroidia bacterium]